MCKDCIMKVYDGWWLVLMSTFPSHWRWGSIAAPNFDKYWGKQLKSDSRRTKQTAKLSSASYSASNWPKASFSSQGQQPGQQPPTPSRCLCQLCNRWTAANKFGMPMAMWFNFHLSWLACLACPPCKKPQRFSVQFWSLELFGMTRRHNFGKQQSIFIVKPNAIGFCWAYLPSLDPAKHHHFAVVRYHFPSLKELGNFLWTIWILLRLIEHDRTYPELGVVILSSF